ncbi:MAG: SDR family oxidoreductase, partial [Desulfobacterales bacterium]|nr:SDR family oxidoreductase [Desulfobacterales bacterium]
LMTALGRAALHGVSIHWPRLHAGEKRRRVPLPGYPFERERYWTPPLKPPIKRSDAPAPPRGARASAPDLFSRDPDPGRWLYAPSWKRAVPAAPAATGSGARRDGCLVFTDRDDWGAEMKSRLREMYRELICVYPAHDYAASGRREYALNPGGREGYVQLVRELANQGRIPGSVIHLWSLADSESADRGREKGFYSLLYFCQALAEEKYFDSPGDSMEIRVVTRGMFDVTGEEALDPGRATLRGVCQVVSQEQPRIRFRIIDVCETGAKNRTSVIEQIFRELHSGRTEPATALRGRGRWVEHHEALREETASNGIGFREKGVYWITGGWGRIGFALAKHLARNHGARLALTGRRPGPGALVETLASLGAETLDLQADVADEEQMARALEEIRRRFGAPDGVIHAAGVVEPSHLFKAFQQTDPDHCRRHFDPKIRGVRVLEKLLPRETDFVVLFSSLSTVLGGVGFTAYAAGNHFLDAFAVSRARKGRSPWISISWPGWRFTGDPGPFDIRPDEGIDVLERILSSHGRLPQIVVSTTDLRARIENPLQLAEAAAKKGAAKKGAPDKSAPGRAPRGAGEDPGPRNEIEEALVEIWKELLGYRTIRVDDNFFELGGDSLMAIALAERIRQRFSMEISVHNLFDAPTIADLAGKIEPSASPSPRGAPPAEVDLPGRAPREKASRKYDSKSWSPLALIKTSGSAPPFFCASAAFGSAFPFYRLAMHLEEDQPFYGLQCPGMDGERPPLETIEELADLYLKAIRTVQPRGPYFLGGYSFGGWVAYEMARRLAKEGEAPALLAIVGAGLPPEMGKPPSFDVRSDDFMARVDQMSESFLDAFLSRGQRERSHLLQVVKANNRASFLYRPRPYAGAMNLFLTGEFLSQTPDASLGWSILCRGEVVSHLVSGNHISTLHEPHVADLAGKLTFVLNKEQKKR